MSRKEGKQKLIIFLIFLLLLVANILAAATDISIKTLPNRKLFIQYLQSGETYVLIKNSTTKGTGMNGEVLVSNSFSEKSIDLRLILKEDSKTVLNERIENIKTGSPVYISFIPGNVSIIEKKEIEPVVNQTNITETNLTATPLANESKQTDIQETNKSKIGLTGFAVNVKDFGSKVNSKINWKLTLYFVIGIVFIIVILFMVVFAKKRLKNKNQSFKVVSSKEYFDKKSGYDSDDDALNAVEEKIKLAQEEIGKIKQRKEKIKEAERKLEQDRSELEKIRSGNF